MKTKILSIFIALLIAISVITPYVYADSTDSLLTEYAQNNEFLKAVGIYDADFNENGSKVLSRGDFLHYAFRLLNYPIQYVEQSPFWDLNSDYVHYDSVVNAYKCGIVKGYSDGSVGVYNSITVEDAVAILLRILGYDSFLSEAYGYPAGVYKLGVKLKIVDDLSFDKELTYSGMSALLKRVLRTPLMNQTKYGDTQFFDNNEDVTLLSQNFDIYYIEGIVEADQISSLNRETASDSTGIKISGTSINMNHSGTRYLGYNVECWYRDVNSKKEVVYINPIDNKVTTIFDAQFDDVSDTEISYYADNNKKRVKIGKTTVYIDNGKKIDYATEFNKGLFNINEGSIITVDSTGDNVADVVYINNYYNFVVKSYSETENALLSYDRRVIKFDDYDVYSIKDIYNKNITFSDIKEYDVLSVLESNDKKYVDIIVSYNRITAECGGISKTNGYDKVTLKGQTYEIAPDYYAADSISHYLGKPAVFGINSFNRVAAVYNESLFGTDKFALLINAAAGSGLSGAKGSKIQILDNSDNEYTELNLNSRVKIDGTTLDADKAISKLWENPVANNKLIGKFIRYGLNEEGLVHFIDTPADKPEDKEEERSLTTVWTPSDISLKYKGYGYFAVKYYKGRDTKFYGLPSAASMAKGDYECECYDDLENDYEATPYIYTMGDRTVIMSGVIIEKTNLDITANQVEPTSDMFVVDIITSSINAKGEEIKLLKLVSETGEVAVPVEKKQEALITGLERGDVIRYKMTLSGKLSAVQKIFNYSDKTAAFPDNDYYLQETHNQIRVGVAQDLYDDLYIKTALINKKDIATLDTLSKEAFVNIDITKSHVFKVERDSITFEPASPSNIKTYEPASPSNIETFESDASIVISVMSYNQPVDMLILSE